MWNEGIFFFFNLSPIFLYSNKFPSFQKLHSALILMFKKGRKQNKVWETFYMYCTGLGDSVNFMLIV